ncbi:hypothetical protein J2Y54_000745 [Sphingomonas sp. BE123]|jgi:hypothetical protein|uniref:hypothetical protein n=1 Tax=unclassified Sphingomonas TaxID=196159 RepID=UPI002859EEBC|nr:hypothetical protein [Sphingomonas sp. BE123]MDR6851252.1 hypothetical protein [Sphingomonas sp. BE123]
MTLGELAVALAAAWLGLTIVVQFRPLSRKLPMLDRLGLLPRWLFFTQGVGGYSFTLEVRVRDGSDGIGAWTSVPLAPPWRWWHAFFYPGHAQVGALWLAVHALASRAERGDSDATLAGTLAFAALRTHVRQAMPSGDLQLALLRSDAADAQPRRVFLSEFGSA